MLSHRIDLRKYHIDLDPMQQLMVDAEVAKLLVAQIDRMTIRRKNVRTIKCRTCGGSSLDDPDFCSLECANRY